jgi:DivIVA domain-containing protein
MVKKQLTAEAILQKKFLADVKGYAALEVDQFLDIIVKDYQAIELFLSQTLPKLEMNEKLVQTLQQKLHNLEIEASDLRDKVAVIKKNETVEINQSNFHLIKRLGLLEKELYKLGIDPNKLK